MSLISKFFGNNGSKKKAVLRKKALERSLRHFGKQTSATVKVPGTGLPTSTSHIIEIARYEDGYCILLDEFVPSRVNKSIKPKTKLHIKLQSRGVTVTFEALVLAQKQQGGAPIFYVSIPEKIQEKQARSSYRATVPIRLSALVTLMSEGRPSIKGHLHNISTDGVGVIVKTPVAPPFRSGEIIDGCYVELPSGTVQCQIEVRQFNRTVGGKKMLGAAYKSFKKNARDELNKFLMECQRSEEGS